jgi:hypothetical protein
MNKEAGKAEETLSGLEYVADQLADLYEPDEARVWLLSRQKLLNGEIPAELIRQHRTDEVIKVVRQLLDGAFV